MLVCVISVKMKRIESEKHVGIKWGLFVSDQSQPSCRRRQDMLLSKLLVYSSDQVVCNVVTFNNAGTLRNVTGLVEACSKKKVVWVNSTRPDGWFLFLPLKVFICPSTADVHILQTCRMFHRNWSPKMIPHCYFYHDSLWDELIVILTWVFSIWRVFALSLFRTMARTRHIHKTQSCPIFVLMHLGEQVLQFPPFTLHSRTH